jgi:hypothetical protein
VRENDLFFAADPKCFTIETAGLGRFLHDHARTPDSGKARAIPAATDAKFLTATSVSRGACGSGRACNTATTFHVLYRLQVTNFSLLKSAPNGVNYIDIRRWFLHGRFRLPD